VITSAVKEYTMSDNQDSKMSRKKEEIVNINQNGIIDKKYDKRYSSL
jgi:hypothetical protein